MAHARETIVRIARVLAAAMMALALVACSGREQESRSEPDNQPASESPAEEGEGAAKEGAAAVGEATPPAASAAAAPVDFSGLSDDVKAFVAVSAQTVALRNALVIDGTGAPARRNQTLIIHNGSIQAMGDEGTVAIPDGAEILDLAGKTVTPGFVMVHEHMFYPTGKRSYTQHSISFPRMYLAGGATTIRTGGSMAPYADLNIKQGIDRGELPGPDIEVTGPFLNAPGLGILQVNSLSGPADARRMVGYWADEGATSFKGYMHVSRAELGAVIEEAHSRRLQVTAHLCSVTYREAADLGIDNLEHGFLASSDFVADKKPDTCPSGGAVQDSLRDLDIASAEVKALFEHLIANEVAITSTMTVFETFTPGRPQAPKRALDAMTPPIRQLYVDQWTAVSKAEASQQWIPLLAKGMALELAFVRAGGTLLVGTDPTGYGGVVPGYANQRAIELLVEAGFSVEETIAIATRNGARFLRRDDRIGTLEAGKRADLVVIDGDLATDVAAIAKVEVVFKNGVGFDSAKLFASVVGEVGLH